MDFCKSFQTKSKQIRKRKEEKSFIKEEKAGGCTSAWLSKTAHGPFLFSPEPFSFSPSVADVEVPHVIPPRETGTNTASPGKSPPNPLQFGTICLPLAHATAPI
jgi:hypothetical protein